MPRSPKGMTAAALLFSFLRGPISGSVKPLPLLLVSHQASAWVSPLSSSIRATQRRTYLSSSASAEQEEEEEASDEDLSRWDQMYQQGEARRNRLDAIMNPESIPGSQALELATTSPVRVVTFDLDNTLWNTGATIGAANNVLAEFLNSQGIVQSKRTEQIMGDLFQASKGTYCPLASEDELDKVKAPVLLTRLRKDALTQILIQDNGYTEEDARQFANEAFEKWMEARYQAIPSNYASNVVHALQQISALRNNLEEACPLLVGAITDGNSDPRNVPDLEPYFDFCINAEQVGVSKPDPRVYQQAMDYVQNHPHVQDMHMVAGDDQEEAVAGPWWIHIGDDFTKDVVAAKNFNMRTIWARELIMDKLPQAKEQAIVAANNKKNPEKELLEFQERINSQTVVKMAVGAEDYLMASLQQEFADAVIDRFANLPKVLQAWHEESLRQPQLQQSSGTRGEVFVPDEADLVNRWQPQSRPPPSPQTSPAPPAGSEQVYVPDEADLVKDLPKAAPATKFCVFCGAKIPAVAKFCSSCSKEQPQIQ